MGYTISYYLDKFIKTTKQTYFAGDYIFKENAFNSDRDKAKILRNRENAYDGSRMQLIRVLWNHTLKQSGFTLYTPDYTPLTEKDIVVSDAKQNKYLRLEGRVKILYNNDRRALNSVTCPEELSFIDSSGFYNAGLRWAGEMGQQRVGDLLPFDYQSRSESKIIANATTSTIAVKKDKKKSDETNKKLALFKSIVLVKDNPLDDEPVIRKWTQPVYYKIYGTCGNKDLDEILINSARSLFKLVADNSSLQIKSTTDDKAVNFFIILNGSAEKYRDVLPADAVSYFARLPQSPGYYTYNESGFTSMVKLVHVENIIDSENISESAVKFPIIGSMLRQHILNGLGFFNLALYKQESIFNNDVHLNEAAPQIKAADIDIIKSLYRPDVRSGMSGPELDNILNEQPSH